MIVLAGDIGATKTNLGLFTLDGDSLRKLRSASYRSREFPGLLAVVERFLGEEPGVGITAACFGIAGPVVANAAKTSNLPWFVDGDELGRALGIGRAELINDLVAMGEGLGELSPAALVPLQEGRPDPRGNAAIVAAGTGLGIVFLGRVGERLVPFPSEGGHSDYPARTDSEIDLLRALRTRFGHVWVEHVLSGPGLRHIYEHLRDSGVAPELPEVRAEMARGDAGEVIGRRGAEGACELCRRTLAMFVEAYGAIAGNVALLGLATAGVYLGGGIAPKLLPQLQDGRFREAFLDKGDYRALLERIPVRVILEPETPLLGAARRATRGARDAPAAGW
jgi:glucokinase